MSYRAFWASKLTPLWTRFFEQNFRISITSIHVYITSIQVYMLETRSRETWKSLYFSKKNFARTLERPGPPSCPPLSTPVDRHDLVVSTVFVTVITVSVAIRCCDTSAAAPLMHVLCDDCLRDVTRRLAQVATSFSPWVKDNYHCQGRRGDWISCHTHRAQNPHTHRTPKSSIPIPHTPCLFVRCIFK